VCDRPEAAALWPAMLSLKLVKILAWEVTILIPFSPTETGNFDVFPDDGR
jgi:hypothetical protein